MVDSAGQPTRHRAIDRYVAKFQDPEIQVRQLLSLWATAMIGVMLVCAGFLFAAFWLLA